MNQKTKTFNAIEYLETDKDIDTFLTLAAQDSPEHFSFCLGIVAKQAGITELSQVTGLGRTSLYKALSAKGDMKISTLMTLLEALGLSIEIKHKKPG